MVHQQKNFTLLYLKLVVESVVGSSVESASFPKRLDTGEEAGDSATGWLAAPIKQCMVVQYHRAASRFLFLLNNHRATFKPRWLFSRTKIGVSTYAKKVDRTFHYY